MDDTAGRIDSAPNRLREYRVRSKYALQDVVERLIALSDEPLGIDRSAVARHEQGKVGKPHKRYRRLYAKLYGVSEEDLWPVADIPRAAFAGRRPPAVTESIRTATEWLDRRADWEPGQAYREVSSYLSMIDVGTMNQTRAHRRRFGKQKLIAGTLAGYYGDIQSTGTLLYSARIDSGPKVMTSILTRPEWLDLAVPLEAEHDRLALGTPPADPDLPLTPDMVNRATRRLAEAAMLGTRLFNRPLYTLRSIDLRGNAIAGTLGITEFNNYALTVDLMELELIEALAKGTPGDLPIRERCIPDVAAVLDFPKRLCAGGIGTLCAVARPAGRHRAQPDYVLLVQERSGKVLNATHQLSVIPKGFHQPTTDVRGDVQLGATVRRELEEELFGREDADNTETDSRHADPMHPNRLSEPMRWLDAHPDAFTMECTGFGINLVSGNYEFACLVVIDDVNFWHEYGGQIEANWESAGLRQFSSLDRELLGDLVQDDAWSNEGLFALLSGLKRLDARQRR